MDDLTIIEMYFSRNEKAIEETDKKYGKLCFGIAKNILASDEDSEECVSDTYLNTWNAIPPTRPVNFRALICRIVRFLSLKRLDYNTAAKRSQNMTVSFSELEDVLSNDCFSSDSEYADIGRIISEFLYREKEDSRNVFVRKYYFFDSVGEIAKRYSFTESKVKNMLYHSRIKLKKYLEKEGVEV